MALPDPDPVPLPGPFPYRVRQTRFILSFASLIAVLMLLTIVLVEHHLGAVMGARSAASELAPATRALRLALASVGLLAVALGVLGTFVMARRITRPLADVVGQVQANQRAVEDLNRGLEVNVRARTEELSRANEALTRALEDLRQAQTQMVQSEKMASLGQFVAGIAHEINTPSSAIHAAIFNVAGELRGLAGVIPALAEERRPGGTTSRFVTIVERALSADFARRRASTEDIRHRARALEKTLVASGFEDPHELALTFSRLGLHDEIASVLLAGEGRAGPAVLRFLENVGNLAIAVADIRVSIAAITRMVKALKSYSHLDQADMTQADLHDGIETTLTILRSHLRYGVVVERRYGRLPLVTCNLGELNQVWTNLIHNAVQAMGGMGHLVIETYVKEGFAGVRITDDGPGIPASIRGRVFDPFFTTKDQGEGTGLGLGISQQIVQKHGGRIDVESEPGRTSFEVLLPLRPQAVKAAS